MIHLMVWQVNVWSFLECQWWNVAVDVLEVNVCVVWNINIGLVGVVHNDMK